VPHPGIRQAAEKHCDAYPVGPGRDRAWLSNGRAESVNTEFRLLTRIAFGLHGPDARVAMAMLSLGGHRPAIPHRK
jgi:hypothetical protein